MALFLQHREPSFQWGIWKMEEPIDVLLGLLPERAYYEEEHKEVCYEPSGKPYLADNSYFISISHTKGYIAVILSEEKPVGIDIEQYSRRVHKVAHKYMREDEQLVSYGEDDTWSLLLHWSAKEVMFKCMNTSEVDFREHLHIEPFTIEQQGIFLAHEYRTEQQRNFRIHYLIHPEFVMTWQID